MASTSDYSEGQQTPAGALIELSRGGLEAVDDVTAQSLGVAGVLDLQSLLPHGLQPVEVRHGAHRDDQDVVAQLITAKTHDSIVQVDALHPGSEEINARLPEGSPDGRQDQAGMNHTTGGLVQQGREQMEVVLVHEGDPRGITLRQSLVQTECRVEPGEAGAQNEDVFLSCSLQSVPQMIQASSSSRLSPSSWRMCVTSCTTSTVPT